MGWCIVNVYDLFSHCYITGANNDSGTRQKSSWYYEIKALEYYFGE